MTQKAHRNYWQAIIGLLLSWQVSWATTPFKIEQWKTSRGVPVFFHQTMEVPILDIRLAFAAGSAYDNKQYGLSVLTTRLLDQGSNDLDANAIADRLAEVGAQYDTKVTKDMSIIALRTLTDHKFLKPAIDTLELIINHPTFSNDAVNQQKKQQLMAIAQAEDLPDQIADDAFYRILYQEHPYAHPINGNKDTLDNIHVDQIRDFYCRYFVTGNAKIILIGAIDSSTAHQLAEQITHDLTLGKTASPIPEAPALRREINIEIPYDAQQSVLRLGQLGITHHNKDYFPLLVGNYILGHPSLVSRLAEELRETRGLTYSVFSQLAPMQGKGPFLISLSTRTSQTQHALNITRETLNTFVKKGPDEKELEAAKHYLTGSFPVALANNHDMADLLVKIAFYNLPNDFLSNYSDHINAVSVSDIHTAFQRLIHPKQLLQISVGK